jgi:two-component system CheB/CheR fusion protein
MPYRTLDDRIDGVVITFADITAAKTLEAQLREKHDLLEKHIAEQSKTTENSAGRAQVETAGPKRRAPLKIAGEG